MAPIVSLRALALLLVAAVLATACTTPAVTLKNPRTGQVARCGGNVSSSLAGGVYGYNRQLENDDRCRRDYESAGFRRMR